MRFLLASHHLTVIWWADSWRQPLEIGRGCPSTRVFLYFQWGPFSAILMGGT